LLASSRLRQLLEPARHDLGGPVSAVVQSALAGYLESGALRRHTARMRRSYAAKRELVVERLYGARGVRARPMSGGLHAVIEFSEGGLERERAVLERCSGLGAVALSGYWHGAAHAHLTGLIIGTGGDLEQQAFDEALVRLR